ncbi:MAG: DUF6020 family protein [Atopobiaceae bacterium]|nr:DUF6020 family protein [Atopobiaceae bacterium]MCI2173861.1 DUF6020 family protein [Atopobiaceae bacterium]MCI2208049.1 DUF6020 family protein [Atopobiaceae bacterium]
MAETTRPQGKATVRTHWRPSRRDVILAVAVALVVGVCLSVGREFYATSGGVSFGRPMIWLRALAYAVAVFALLLVLFRVTDAVSSRPREGSRLSRWLAGLDSHRRRLLVWVAVIVLFVPAFLAFYPGNYSSDAPEQVTTLLNQGVLDLHWPAAHTLALAGCLELGHLVLGSFDAGLTLFCVCQALLIAYALAFAADRLISWKVPAVPVIVLVLLVAANPVIQYFAFATTKDSLFSAFLLISFVELIDLLRTPKRFTSSPSRMFAFLAAATGMCLMRKQGLYVLIVVMLVALPFVRGWATRLKVMVPAVGALVVTSVFGMVVGAVFVTKADSSREVLSVPSQQVARTYMLCHDDLTDEQIEQIGRYYDLDALEAGRTTDSPWEGYAGIGTHFDSTTGRGYLEPVSDPAKAALDTDAYSSDTAGYWSMWLSLMGGHEGVYLEAFLWGDVGYVYPTSAAANRWSTMVSPWNEFSLTIDGVPADEQVSDYGTTSLLPAYRDWLVGNGWNMFASCQPLMLLTSPALPFLLLTFSFVLLVRRGGRLLVAWLLPFVYWLSLSLGPVMCLRYVAPLFLCAPVIVCMPFVPRKHPHAMHAAGKDGNDAAAVVAIRPLDGKWRTTPMEFLGHPALVVCAAMSAVVISLCDAVDGNGYLHLGPAVLLQTLGLSLLLASVFLFARYVMSRTVARVTEGSLPRRKIIVCAGVMFLCWLPWLIALYPANYLGDTLISVGWFTKYIDGSSVLLSDHNPILTVLLYGSIATFGRDVIGDAGIAFFIYVLLQSFFCSLAFSLALVHAERRLGLPKVAAVFLFLIYALCPLFPVWNDFISKDSLYAPLFLVWLVYLVETLRTRGALLAKSRRRTLEFVLITILSCLVKKLGFYIVAGTLLVTVIWAFVHIRGTWRDDQTFRAGARRLVATLVFSAIVMMVLLPKIVFPLVGIQPSETYELYSIQLQQTARYVVDHGDDVTPEEHEAIDALLGYDDLADRCVWYLSDPVKYAIQEPTDAYGDWFKAYVAEGLRHPGSYFQTYTALESDFGKSDALMKTQLDSSFMGDYDASGIPEAYTSEGIFISTGEYAQKVYSAVESLPLVGVLFHNALYSLVIPFFLFGMIIESSRETRPIVLLAGVAVLLTLGGVWISPVSVWSLGNRYLLPLLYAAPYLICLAWMSTSHAGSVESDGAIAGNESQRDSSASKLIDCEC